jgi:hypothetical protein
MNAAVCAHSLLSTIHSTGNGSGGVTLRAGQGAAR